MELNPTYTWLMRVTSPLILTNWKNMKLQLVPRTQSKQQFPVRHAATFMHFARAAERIGGSQGKYKKVGFHKMYCVRGGLGARPQAILRFYNL